MIYIRFPAKHIRCKHEQIGAKAISLQIPPNLSLAVFEKAAPEEAQSEAGKISPQTESLFVTHNQVGDITQQLYGTDKSVEIAFDFKSMVAATSSIVAGGADFPIFEATFRYENVLVRADVLISEGDG